MSEVSAIEQYPSIKKAALLMARANGMINRATTEEEFLAQVNYVLLADGVDTGDLRRLDAWLEELDGQDQREGSDKLLTLVDGEADEIAALCRSGPTNSEGRPLTAIFDDIFEQG